jgi:hypothetical protein
MSHDVSVLNGRHAMLAVGPFRRHGDALSHVDAFRRWVEQARPMGRLLRLRHLLPPHGSPAWPAHRRVRRTRGC